MPTVSLCMIVKDEEMHIARCLDSIAELVDEIIITACGWMQMIFLKKRKRRNFCS